MLALNPVVVAAVWRSFAAYLPKRGHTNHPLGCHRPRISDRDCFEAILFRLSPGAPGTWPEGWAKVVRPPSAGAVTSGWQLVRSNTWSKRPSTPSTR